MFKAGDRVKCIKLYEGWITVGEEFEVIRSDNYSTTVATARGHGGLPNFYFELADPNSVEITIRGTIQNRNGDVVTIKTSDGDSVIVPAKLAPEDPALAVLRKIIGAFYDKRWPGASYAREARNGHMDSDLRKMLPDVKGLLNV